MVFPSNFFNSRVQAAQKWLYEMRNPRADAFKTLEQFDSLRELLNRHEENLKKCPHYPKDLHEPIAHARKLQHRLDELLAPMRRFCSPKRQAAQGLSYRFQFINLKESLHTNFVEFRDAVEFVVWTVAYQDRMEMLHGT